MTGQRADGRWTENRVWARHPRRSGSALIVGAGAVGGFLAEELARIGFSPLCLVDPDTLAVENLVRHPLGARAVGRPKATALAESIGRDFPPCAITGLDRDFLAIPEGEQRALVAAFDVVVAATDSIACQRHVNRVALAAGVPAVYPAVWVDRRIRDAEVGEILWVLPGGRTPCYECAAAFRESASDAQAARGARVDIQLVVLATAQIVRALAHPDDEGSVSLDPQTNAVYLHGLTPTSPAVRAAFPTSGLSSRNVRVSFPARPCPACHGRRAPLAPGTLPGQEPILPVDGESELQRPPLTVIAVIALFVLTFFVATVVHAGAG
ncbi:ThiF family adenylyltransferase [Actinacidiphila acidipaludis]|uniref:ThiF family adenylyltransferase n=1 Tax=Actinacidiphila acidipaludis TaxID=2873382 RepID=A0ABS7QE96_9ACTN|nr:ThiF family adenylyltransferase [Streptomyces acidipaludis]MBY8880247.1 ThiF family adenylyltransferase [Streptomyces acidipaludis]